MKILERIYNWLCDIDPTNSIKKYRQRQLSIHSFDRSNPDFCKWAFGKDYDKLSPEGKRVEWNIRHGDKHFIEEVDHLYDDRIIMGKLWVDYVATKHPDAQ